MCVWVMASTSWHSEDVSSGVAYDPFSACFLCFHCLPGATGRNEIGFWPYVHSPVDTGDQQGLE